MSTAIGTQQEQGRLQKEASQQQHATNLYTTVTQGRQQQQKTLETVGESATVGKSATVGTPATSGKSATVGESATVGTPATSETLAKVGIPCKE
jgi:hypothetical protein